MCALVIKVFGIYTHAQLHNRPWDSIGRQLGKKGKEYRRRCVDYFSCGLFFLTNCPDVCIEINRATVETMCSSLLPFHPLTRQIILPHTSPWTYPQMI